jgi:hypothetical protein
MRWTLPFSSENIGDFASGDILVPLLDNNGGRGPRNPGSGVQLSNVALFIHSQDPEVPVRFTFDITVVGAETITFRIANVHPLSLA